jgi:Ca2+-binding EF-hand superfamily protein
LIGAFFDQKCTRFSHHPGGGGAGEEVTDWDWEDLLEELDEDNDGQLSAKVRRNNAFLFFF